MPDLQANYTDPIIRAQLGWKTCPVCGKSFTQRKPPKAEQTFCTWLCYLKARNTT